ncbi:hypothetical protein GM182_07175 [bacterium 3DAC]|jgi:multicomponent Na+:H+ antiporter subunit C|nr:hypothetical protein [Dictyoglomota bacterium]UZN23626.1 hypothetical protein GM182_07175 [bacterium 3DAC]
MLSVIFYGILMVMFLLGLAVLLLSKNAIKAVMGLAVMTTALNVFLVSLGYVKGGTAPIFFDVSFTTKAADPIPQALTLTSIVIDIALTALALGFAVYLFKKTGSVDLRDMRRLRG